MIAGGGRIDARGKGSPSPKFWRKSVQKSIRLYFCDGVALGQL